MAEDTDGRTTEGQQGTDGNQGGTTSTTDKPFTLTQEEFNRQLDERVKRERAKFSDYDELKAQAAELAEIKERDKSESQKLTDRLAAIEKERDMARTEGLRLKIAVQYGISEEDAELFLTGVDQKSLTKQAERLAQREKDRVEAEKAAELERKKQGNFVAREGSNDTTTPNADREAVRQLFGG